MASQWGAQYATARPGSNYPVAYELQGLYEAEKNEKVLSSNRYRRSVTHTPIEVHRVLHLHSAHLAVTILEA